MCINHLLRLCFVSRSNVLSLSKLQPGKTPGVDGLPAKLYRRLPLNLKRHLAARLWDIAIGKTDVPPDWANLVHPLYQKGNWASPDS